MTTKRKITRPKAPAITAPPEHWTYTRSHVEAKKAFRAVNEMGAALEDDFPGALRELRPMMEVMKKTEEEIELSVLNSPPDVSQKMSMDYVSRSQRFFQIARERFAARKAEILKGAKAR